MRNGFVVFACYTAHNFHFFPPSNSTCFHLIMSNSAGIASTSEELSEPFDGINTGNIIPLLLALPAIDCPEQKLFFKTYKKWDALSFC